MTISLVARLVELLAQVRAWVLLHAAEDLLAGAPTRGRALQALAVRVLAYGEKELSRTAASTRGLSSLE